MFEYDDPYEQVVDDEELEMNKFAADTAAQIGGEMVRGINAARFFEERQAVQTQRNLDAQQVRLMESIYDRQPEHRLDKVAPTATDYLERIAAPIRSLRATTRAATADSKAAASARSTAKPKDGAVIQQTAEPATAKMAKGTLSCLDGTTVFAAHHNSTFTTIAQRFGLDPEVFLDETVNKNDLPKQNVQQSLNLDLF